MTLNHSPDLQQRFLTAAHISAIEGLLSDNTSVYYAEIKKEVEPLLCIISKNADAVLATGPAEALAFLGGASSTAAGSVSAPEGPVV